MFGDLPFLAVRLFAAAYPFLFLWAAYAHGQLLQAYGDLLHGSPDLAWPLAHMALASLMCCLSFAVAYHGELLGGDVTELEHAANGVCVFLHFLVTVCLFFISLMLIAPLFLAPVTWCSVVGFFMACPWWWSMLREAMQ
jgi:hypothetical protein